MTRHTLGKLVKRLGQRAGVNNVYPHKFRHTFAIQSLRTRGILITHTTTSGRSDKAFTRISNETVVPPIGGGNGPTTRILIGLVPTSSMARRFYGEKTPIRSGILFWYQDA